MDNNKPLLRISDIAEKLNVSLKTVRRHIHSGKLQSTKIGGVHRISEADYLQFLNTFKSETIEKQGAEKQPKHLKSKKTDTINWTDISDLWDTPKATQLTSADLFSGTGGMALGFQLAGFTPLCGLDWFKEAGESYRKNLKHPHIEGDITSNAIKKEFIYTVKQQLNGKPLTVLSGGFPCQGFSMSGSRIVEDERNSLYKDMLDIISELNPEYIVAENVKGLRSMLKGKVENKIIKDIEALGYNVNVTVLNAADYYVPQKRERIIFIANKINKTNYHPAPLLEPATYITTKEAIKDLIKVKDNPSINHVRTKHREDMKTRLAAVPEGKSLYDNYSDSWKKCSWNEASCTIKENHGGVNIHPIEPRVITVREMARLQSFPDWFIFEGSKSKQMVQIGNAVPPLLAKAIGLAIRKSYDEK
ncbi:DNA cytosine methyltransferase [Bizionia gelidisalsuginis]|uniref:DNA (cytosine-5-)-methyltransferase n=2 Tax=Bizionia TaxID=283785 RepID=A0A8H2LG04_9FLAO|nr:MULTISPECIES: DNA cytosine methyltransferase [Bizionia]TYB72513.1 DNA cytosine methyltransferase [Bizionia saleffrena]TYC09640.1 DNA cytosine methyltransferase [Bizionia gelidisalsuginis]